MKLGSQRHLYNADTLTQQPGTAIVPQEDGEVADNPEEINPFPFMKRWTPEEPKEKLLICQDNDVRMVPSVPPKSCVYRYHVLDDSRLRLTNNFNLAEQLADIEWGPRKEPGEATQPHPEEQPEVLKHKQPQSRAGIRYFSALSKRREDVVCRRCRVKGHYVRHCNTFINTVCIYCVGHHSMFYTCQQSCALPLNIELQNTLREIKQICPRCSRLSHQKKRCGYLACKASSAFCHQQLIEPDQQQLDQAVCLRCLKTGHINCSPEPASEDDGLFKYSKPNQRTGFKLES